MKKYSNPPPPKNVKKPLPPPAPPTNKQYTRDIILLKKLIRRAEDKTKEHYAKYSAYCEVAINLKKELEECGIFEELKI